MSTKVQNMSKSSKPKEKAKPKEAEPKPEQKKPKLSKPRKPEKPQPSKEELVQLVEKEMHAAQTRISNLTGELIGIKALDVPQVVEIIEDLVAELNDRAKECEGNRAEMLGANEALLMAEQERARIEADLTRLETQVQKIRSNGFKSVVEVVDEEIRALREERSDNDAHIDELRKQMSA
jgi:hypothetical protein